jgi:hypothetical protein
MTRVRFEVLTAETASMNVLLYVMLCSSVEVYGYFGECLCHHGRGTEKWCRYIIISSLFLLLRVFLGPVSRLGLNVSSLFCF